MALADALFQALSSVQSNLSPVPNTIASTATVTPTTFLTFLTGTTAVTTINPPILGCHTLVFVFTNAAPGGLTAGTGVGQPKSSVTATQNVPVILVFDPITSLYWAGTLKLS